jgi:hypothetical protein
MPGFEKFEPSIRRRPRNVPVSLFMRALVLLMISYPAFSQTESLLDPVHPPDGSIQALNFEAFTFATPDAPEAFDDSGGPGQPEQPGLLHRDVGRVLRDQERGFTAPPFAAPTLNGMHLY